MEKRLLIALIVLLVLYFNFPKTAFIIGEEEIISCSCMGFSFETGGQTKKCIGLTFECVSESTSYENTTLSEKKLKEICKKKTCSQFQDYLGVQDPGEGNGHNVERINMLIIIDTSFSMLGEKIEKTVTASKTMIESLNPEDRVGIIEFNSLSSVIHEFSTDKAAVVNSLSNLVPREYTRYVSALELASERFTLLDDPAANNIIIFLSDGVPLDNVSDIIDITNELDSMGVWIYTIRMGDINESSIDTPSWEVDEDILERMTNILEGQGFYTTKDVDTVLSTFDSIYQDIVKETDTFHITKNIKDELDYPEDFSLPIVLQLFSSENMRVVPGFMVSESEILCVDDAKVDLVIRDIDDKIVENASMDYIGGQYISEVTGLWEGTYTIDAEISVSFENSSDCSFFDSQQIARLNIYPQENDSCRKLTCDEIKQIFKDPARGGGELPTETKRLLFAIDSSASMNDEGKLRYATAAIRSMVLRLTQGFSMGVMSFNGQANLLQRFTQSKQPVLDTLDTIEVGGTTNYIPAFRKAYGLLGDSSFDHTKELPKDFMVFISDGLPWDQGVPDSIMKETESLVDNGVCIFTIGYGSDVALNPEAEDILRGISSISKEHLDCGGYYYSDPSEDELDEIFSYIFSDIADVGEIFIKSSINAQIFESDDQVTIFSNIYSSYNALELPNVDNSVCPLDAHISMTSIDDSNNTLQEQEMTYAPDMGYHIIKEDILPGSTMFRLDAWVLDGNETVCDLHGTRLIPVRVINGESDTYRFYLSLSSMLINLFMMMVLVFSLVLLIKTRKKIG